MPIRSPYPDLPIPDMTIQQYLLEKGENYEGQTDILMNACCANERYSYGEFLQAAANLKVKLKELGVKKGDIVMASLPLCPEAIVLLFAVWPLGAAACGLNPAYTEDEIRRAILLCTPRVVITERKQTEKFQKVCSTATNETKPAILLIEDLQLFSKSEPITAKPNKTCINQRELLRELRQSKDISTNSDRAMLFFSSGTTGLPKAVMLSHRSCVSLIHAMSQYVQLKPGETMVHFLPWFHAWGFLFPLISVRCGASAVLMPSFNADNVLRAVSEHKARFLAIVPAAVRAMLRTGSVARLSTVEMMLFSSSTLDRNTSELLAKSLPKLRHIIQCYGMTETAGGTHLTPINTSGADMHHGSAGLVAPNFICKVVNNGTGKECGPMETGELLVKSTVGTLTMGYLKNAEATAALYDSEGWFKTGDLGYFNHEGYFFIVDRVKDLIKVKGFQVSPAELEELLLSSGRVQEAAVVGLTDKVRLEEKPVAFVVPKEDAIKRISEEELLKFVNAKVVPYKRLVRVFFLQLLPKSHNGKVLKYMLRNQFAATFADLSKPASKL